MSNATSDATSHTTSEQSIFYTPNQTRAKVGFLKLKYLHLN